MTTVPLRYRLPNPPADFVGRQEEVTQTTASLKDTHVTVLVGPGGVGKTALALHTLHKRFNKRVPQTLYVSLVGQIDGIELRRELLRALSAAANIEVDWAQLQDHADSLSETLLDLAEAGPFWMFLGELQHAPPAEAAALLETLSLYARDSRYLVTSRTRPEANLASGRVLEIGGLDDQASLQLARQLARQSSPGDVTAAARASGGSPWLLRQALSTSLEGGSGRPSSLETLLGGLSEPVRRFAVMLSRIDVPVPSATLSAAADLAEDHWRSELGPRGWLQESPAGVRLHEVARQGILFSGEDVATGDGWAPNEWGQAALVLVASPSPAVRLEGIRLLIDADALDEAERALDDSLTELLAEGYAPQLWKMLGRVPAEYASGARLRCAAELGNPTVLRQLTQPLSGSPADRLTWAETLYMRGDLTGAMEALSGLGAAAATSEVAACRFDAGLLRGRVLIAQGRAEDARRHLAELAVSSEQESTRREALLQSCAPIDPQSPTARHAALLTLSSLEQRSAELCDRTRARVRFQLAVAYLRHDALDAAEAVLETPGDAGDTLALFERRQATCLQAAVDLARGRLASAQERIEDLDPFLNSPSLIRAEVQCTRARLWMARGQFAELSLLLREALAEAEALGVFATVHRCERLLGRAEELLLLDEGRQRREARSERFLQDLTTSARQLEQSLTRSLASGHQLRAAEQRTEYCVGLLLLDRSAELEREVAELRRSALEMGSPRFQHEADVLGMSGDLDWARLELIADAAAVSPAAARRARALLGADPSDVVDPIDRAVVEKLRGPAHVQLVVPADDGPWRPGWGLDARRKSVWLPTGDWLDLTRRGLLARLLTTLARHGGSATKGQLVEEVWEESEYHPLRHDTRLQVAVHKLRELLEQDAGTPRLLLTTSNGYTLSGPFRAVLHGGEQLVADAGASPKTDVR